MLSVEACNFSVVFKMLSFARRPAATTLAYTLRASLEVNTFTPTVPKAKPAANTLASLKVSFFTLNIVSSFL